MPKRAVFERSRRELSSDVSVGVYIILVVEQSSLESHSLGGVLRRLRYLRWKLSEKKLGTWRLLRLRLTLLQTHPSSGSVDDDNASITYIYCYIHILHNTQSNSTPSPLGCV